MTKINFELLKESFLTFTAICGDEDKGDFFSRWVTNSGGIAWEALSFMPKARYGSGAEGILVALYIQGEFDWFEMPATRSLGPFSKKTKSWRYVVPISIDEQSRLSNERGVRNFFGNELHCLNQFLSSREKKLPPDFDLKKCTHDMSALVEKLRST